MLVLEHMRQLVKACNPKDRAEADLLWASIKPVKFGNVNNWNAANTYTLGLYQVPIDAQYNIVMRVECYTVNLTSGAADYGIFEPPPPGTAYWIAIPSGSSAAVNGDPITSTLMPTQLLLDADEFLVFPGGYDIALLGVFDVSPDATLRNVRTLIYSYNVGADIVERVGANKMLIT